MMAEKRAVEYDGSVYKVRRSSVDIPDFATMDRLSVLIWLNQNTYGKGRSTVRPNPLAGLGEVVSCRIAP